MPESTRRHGDHEQIKDSVAVAVMQEPNYIEVWECPGCKSAAKDYTPPDLTCKGCNEPLDDREWRAGVCAGCETEVDNTAMICSGRWCRKVFYRSQVAPTRRIEGPRFPCPKCGKETKDGHKSGHRICSSGTCRLKFRMSTTVTA